MHGTLLIIDDDCEVRNCLCDLFSDEGYQVASARDGREGLAYLAANPLPCAILLDLMMPIMNGWEFLNHHGADARLAGVPVLVLTAAGNKATQSVQGAAAVLTKPVDVDGILKLVERYCGPPN